ncbi:MAG TPA: hypothetical protein VIJ29_02585 [Candidatus Paceibacterota bacterium]
MKLRFYVLMITVILGLFGIAIWQTCAVSDREDTANLQRFETLSSHELVVRFTALQEVFSGKATTWDEYFTNLQRASALEGGARKAFASEASGHFDTSDREEFIARDIPVQMQSLITQYQARSNETLQALGEDAHQAAYNRFMQSGGDPMLNAPNQHVQGSERLGFWWLLFYTVAMPFMFVHYCIRIRANDMKVRYELLGNPAFPIWVLLWPVGIFKYPKKAHVLVQLRRAQQWAALVLSSAIPCGAANVSGKTCEKDPIRLSLTTMTGSKYLGLADEMLSEHPVQQTSFNASLPCGISAGVFDSMSLSPSNDHPNFGNEVDFTLGWSGSLKGNALDVHGAYIDLSPLVRLPKGDVFQFSERVSRTLPLGKKQSITPYVWLREVMPVRGPTPIGGWFGHGGLVFTRSFGSRVSNSADIATVWDSGALGNHPGLIGTIVDTPSWKIGEHTSLQFPLNVQTPLTHTGDGRRTNFTGGFTLAFSF